MTSLSDVPPHLLDELVGAGLDPDGLWELLGRALEEDLPGGAVDPTSAATIAPGARAVGELQRTRSGASSPASASPSWPST